MSAALSLLDDEPELPRTRATTVPAVPALGIAGYDDRDLGHPNPDALDPHVLRDRATMLKGLKPGGVSVPMLLTATLIASPALVQGLARNSIAFSTMMERWVVITLGCWAVSEGVRRYLSHVRRQAETSGSAEGDDEIVVSDATSIVLPPDTYSS